MGIYSVKDMDYNLNINLESMNDEIMGGNISFS